MIGKAAGYTQGRRMNDIKRILSIDGGGIKGVIPAAFLAAIEESSGKRIVDHFDLIAGTSTGGIIALGLGLGMSAAEILEFYESEGPHIFSQENPKVKQTLYGRLVSNCRRGARNARRVVVPKYNPAALKVALENAFKDRRLGDSATRLVIPAFDCNRREVHIFKTSHHERLITDWKTDAVSVALATAAAPTYLPGQTMDNGVTLLDGGIWANNPVGLAAVEAVGMLRWTPDSLRILSLGCSEEAIPIPDNAGMLGLALKMADIFMLGQSRGAYGTAKLLTGHTEVDPRVFRYQYIAPMGKFMLDGAKDIPRLKGIGANMAREAAPLIEDVFLSGTRAPFSPCRP